MFSRILPLIFTALMRVTAQKSSTSEPLNNASVPPRIIIFIIIGMRSNDKKPPTTGKLGQSEEIPPAAIPNTIMKNTIW